jgi:hypothetical protein
MFQILGKRQGNNKHFRMLCITSRYPIFAHYFQWFFRINSKNIHDIILHSVIFNERHKNNYINKFITIVFEKTRTVYDMLQCYEGYVT